MNPNLQRATVLIEQERWELAEEQLRLSLADDPDVPYSHAVLALCLIARGQLDAAEAEARQAVHLAPDFAFAHYAHSRILNARNRDQEALHAIQQAIQCDPNDADYHSMLAAIHFDGRRWLEALAATENGLQFDPEHTACNNLRAMALVKLGRREEAGATIEATLSRNPDNSVTHANRGWTLLESGDRAKALEHFKESLRLDPTNEWARAGIVESLKASNPIYAVMLRYMFWMSRLNSGVQWGVILGGYLGSRLLSSLSSSSPELAPWILPLQILYITFAVLTWLADPLCNLILRLNRYGRLALSEEQLTSSNWVGGCLLMSVLGLGVWAVSGFKFEFLLGPVVFFALALPVASVWKCQPGWPRTVMAVFAAAMVATGAGAILAILADAEKPAVTLVSCFGIGFMACPWLTNGLMIVRPKL